MTTIDPALRNDFDAMVRDTVDQMTIIKGAASMIEEICEGSKEKFGLSAGDFKAMAKKILDDKLTGEIEKLSNKVDWLELAAESQK